MRRMIVCSRGDGSTRGCHNEGCIEQLLRSSFHAERKSSPEHACQVFLTGDGHEKDSEKVFSQNLWEGRSGSEVFSRFRMAATCDEHIVSRSLRHHRHWRAFLALLTTLFGGFQRWITPNEDGSNRTDGASNQGQEESVIHAHRH